MSKRKQILPALDKAMSQPDTNADGFDSSTPDSMARQIGALKVGESWSRITAVDPAMRLSELPDHLPDVRARFRNNTMPAIRQASQRMGGTFTMEICDLRTLAGHTYVVAVVTRVQ